MMDILDINKSIISVKWKSKKAGASDVQDKDCNRPKEARFLHDLDRDDLDSDRAFEKQIAIR